MENEYIAKGANFGITQGRASNAIEPTQPLTADVMLQTARALELAQEVSARLWSLRDRLFGSRPENGTSPGKPAGANGFAEAYTERSGELLLVLCTIDGLSAEINNRL